MVNYPNWDFSLWDIVCIIGNKFKKRLKKYVVFLGGKTYASWVRCSLVLSWELCHRRDNGKCLENLFFKFFIGRVHNFSHVWPCPFSLNICNSRNFWTNSIIFQWMKRKGITKFVQTCYPILHRIYLHLRLMLFGVSWHLVCLPKPRIFKCRY